MKKLFALMLCAGSVTGQSAFIVPSNPPPVIQLVWSAVPGVTNYQVYYGVGSRQYTNKISTAGATNPIVTLPARGTSYFFAATSQASGLESAFSNEVSFTPATPPNPPTVNPVVVLTVQTKPPTDAAWADAGMNWSLSATQQTQLFRLKIDTLSPPIAALSRPPMPPGIK